MKKTYFKEGNLRVTSEFVKARNRSISLSTLESVDVSRRLFLGALVLCGGLLGFGLVFYDLLYGHEAAILIAFSVLLLWLAWNVGTFTIYSKLTGAKGWSVTWWINPLHKMRAAVETALEEQGQRRRRGGSVNHDEDEDDEEDSAE